MGTTGSGGTDVQRMLAYRRPAQAEGGQHCHCHCHVHVHEDVGPMLAAPFGFEGERHDVCIDALKERQAHVTKLVRAAKELVVVAHGAFLAGAASAADRPGAHAVESWLERLVCEDEYLGIEIRRFDAECKKAG